MPELPDVEGFRRRLARQVRGRRVENVEVLDAGVVRNTDPARLRRALTGRRLKPPRRSGKWLIAPTDGPVLLIHFGMSGSLEWDTEPHHHDRVVLHLDGHQVHYRDQRKLQGLWLAEDTNEAGRIIGPQGPDALRITKARLQEQLTGRRTGLKAALMDQTVVAGLGNIVVDEVLWRARLHPDRRTGSLTAPEWSRLHRALESVLRASVAEGRVPPDAPGLPAYVTKDSPRARARGAGRCSGAPGVEAGRRCGVLPASLPPRDCSASRRRRRQAAIAEESVGRMYTVTRSSPG